MAQLHGKGQEKLRGKIMEMVKRELKTLKAASRELGISYSQAKRIYQRYLTGGDEALVHGNRGRPSNNKTDEGIVKKAVELYREKYDDFGPTLARETLSERDGLEISISTLRRALVSAGLWKQKRNGSEYRSRRTPRARFGELVQFDGSHHEWFAGGGRFCCLMTMIDDATKIRLSLFFTEETMFGAMALLKMWIERHGIPESLYCDKKNAFVLTREPTEAEVLAGILKPKSHFGRACGKLGIEVIAANSPQAKGRVERNHGVDQDRLVKALRLEGISTIEQANPFLLETYLPKMNEKFSRPAKNSDDAHVNPGKVKLDDILCMEFDRRISKDYIIRFQTRLFQVLETNKPLPRTEDKVLVRIQLDHSVHILWKDKPLLVKEIPTMFDV
ncbi:MAG: ISNCY family transposase [Treponema sp.]|jgi:transposase|nr:ISNCY family transposase [Treponema sp.]